MPISATGNRNIGSPGNGVGVMRSREGGFTLIEISLVIVIISVMAMMIAPSFFAATGVSPGQEARRLVKVLRLARDESVLTGQPIRWLAYAHGYSFESLDGEGTWQAIGEQPYAAYKLPSAIRIVEVQPVSSSMTQQANDGEQDSEPVLARLLLLPQGIAEPGRIVLAEQTDGGERITVSLRPGPGGITMNKGQGG